MKKIIGILVTMDLSCVLITTERLKLIPVSSAYAAIIVQEFTPEVTTYMFPKPPETIDDTLTYINTAQEELAKGESLHVTILNAKTEEFLGGGGIHHINTKTPELGIWIKKAGHGHKYGREAITGLKHWAEKNLDYDYLVYPVDKKNVPSRKIPESLGGTVKKEYKKINQSGNELDIVEYWIYNPSKE